MAAALQEAMALHQRSDWHGAEAAYRRALQTEPDNPDALALLGTVLSELKRHDEAIKTIQRALVFDAQAPLFHFHLGNALDKAGKFAEAEVAFAMATAIAPQWAEAWYNLANAQRSQNKDAAKDTYDRVLKLDPSHALAHNNLAMLLNKKGDAKAARAKLEEALKHHPNHAALLLNLSGIAFEQADLVTAFNTARKLAQSKLGIMPGDTSYLQREGFFRNHDEEGFNTLLTLASSTLLQRKYEEASALLRGMMAEEPDMAEALMSLGNIALAHNNIEASEECYAAAFMLNPSDPTAPWNRSMSHLGRGDLVEGFQRYRWRWHALEKHKNIRLDRPMWNGEDINGKTILIQEEQGFGDTLQMMRFMPALKAKGAHVYIHAQTPMFPLLENWDGIDKVLPWDLKSQSVPKEVDYVMGVMDLPGQLRINLKNIPANVPYLPNPRAGNPAYKLEGTKLKIGLVWAGNPLHKRDYERSMPFEKLSAVLAGVDADFYSLQFKPKEEDQKQFAALGITDLSPRIKNLAEMAAFLTQLDLLITIDSAPAHLAGGLGVPTWVMITNHPDWRWLLNRDDSPWYPTVKLFRQPAANDWDGVISALKTALAKGLPAKAH